MTATSDFGGNRRKRVLIGWEFGSGLGHLMQIRLLACDLLDQGCEVFVAVASVANGIRIFWNERSRPRFTLLRTPTATIGRQSTPDQPAVTFADVLVQQGLADRDLLATASGKWRRLLREINPDLIISDFSPVLNLAARGQVPIVVIGNGYTIPPHDRPLPPMAPWLDQTPIDSARHEERICELANSILHGNCGLPITHLGELFHGDRTFICTFPEFDPYQRYPARHHLAPFNIPSFPDPTPLSERPSKDVFIYLPGAHPSLPIMVEVLSTLDRRAVLFAPGIDTKLKRIYESQGHEVMETPADLDKILFRVGLVAHHSGLALAHAALLAGLPQLFLPLGLEHAITAWGARRFGACAALLGDMQVDKKALAYASNILLTDRAGWATAYANSQQITNRRENSRQLILETCLQMISHISL